MSEWQAIEVAPKDGTYILLGAKRVFIGRWSYGDWWGEDDMRCDKPTHWMPLPEPPRD